MKCSICRRDLNAIGQDNMSYSLDKVLFEDCAKGNGQWIEEREV